MEMNIEQKLKMVLAYQNVSQRELARRLGTSSSNLNLKIKRNTLTYEDLQQIAELLGCEWRAEFILPDGTRI